jgi:cytochrome P450
MPYVARNSGGAIDTVCGAPQPGVSEFLADGTAELVAFLKPPVAPVPVDARLWLERLAPATQLAITTAAAASPSLLLWLLKAAGAQSGIVLTDPETVAGVAALVAAGVITTADQTTLLAP